VKPLLSQNFASLFFFIIFMCVCVDVCVRVIDFDEEIIVVQIMKEFAKAKSG
jgi:hypothetical protein